jgi:hypothetical protein
LVRSIYSSALDIMFVRGELEGKNKINKKNVIRMQFQRRMLCQSTQPTTTTTKYGSGRVALSGWQCHIVSVKCGCVSPVELEGLDVEAQRRADCVNRLAIEPLQDRRLARVIQPAIYHTHIAYIETVVNLCV